MNQFIHSFIHFICSTKIKTVALQTENEQDSEAHIYALTAAQCCEFGDNYRTLCRS